jgi:hypothetical protein
MNLLVVIIILSGLFSVHRSEKQMNYLIKILERGCKKKSSLVPYILELGD